MSFFDFAYKEVVRNSIKDDELEKELDEEEESEESVDIEVQLGDFISVGNEVTSVNNAQEADALHDHEEVADVAGPGGNGSLEHIDQLHFVRVNVGNIHHEREHEHQGVHHSEQH